MFHLDFRGEAYHKDTKVMGLSSSEDRVISARVVLTQYQRMSDNGTDGQIYHS